MTGTEAVTLERLARPMGRGLLMRTPLGWVIGIVAGVLLIVAIESLGMSGLQSPLVLGVGLGVSSQQFRALRPVLGSRGRWILMSCLGLALPFLVADAATLAGRPLPYELTTFVVVGGVIASFLQWRQLRERTDGSEGWLFASPAGYVAAAATVWANDRVLPSAVGIVGLLQYVFVIVLAGVFLGALTAVAAARFTPR